MRTHRRTHCRRIVAAVLAALVVPVVPAAALAASDSTQPAAKVGDTPAEFGQPVAPAPKVGDTPAEFGQPVAAAPKVGDTKSDSPGASRAPQYDVPRTIEVVRPERTIVRDADPVLPIVLSGAALLVALGFAGTALIRVRSLRLG